MPDCGSQVVLCDLPIRFDTYDGCTHLCSYCFVRKKKDIETVKTRETPKALAAFISGKRSKINSWCDWNIPLHWGGMSDPFQPAEEKYQNSYNCLKVFADTGYPFAFSTKGRLIATPKYLSVLKSCNAVAQVSLVSQAYDKLEPGAPTFTERLAMFDKLAANTKRLIVRVSPYAAGLADDVCSHIKDYKNAGVFGVEVEGMKRSVKRPGMVKVAGDWCYPLEVLRKEFQQIKDEAKAQGLAFYSGENRLRAMGDDTCCCGVVGVPGFQPNRANLNRLVEGQKIEYTDAMKAPCSGSVFRAISQSTVFIRVADHSPYNEMMDLAARCSVYLEMMGLR